MPSTYTVNLGIEKPATGEQSGTWGDTVNDNSNILDEAINGVVSITLASAGSSGSPNSITITNGALSTGRNKWIEFTDGGDLGAAAYVQLTPNDAEKICFIRNSLTASRSIFLFQGTYNASNDLEIAAGTDVVVKFNGGGTGATVVNVYANLKVDGIVATTADINGGTVDGTVIGGAAAAALTATTVVANTSLNIAGTTTISSVLDEDNMASDSATALATQQSIKAYVDSQVGTVDTLSEILANGNTTGANDIDVDAAQKVQFRDAAIYINSSVDGQLDIVADTEIQIAATTIDINGAINASGEIIAASLDISGNVDIDGITNLDVVDIDGAVQIDAAVTVGIDDTGYDVKFYGATGGAYMLWDESADDLILAGAGGLVVAGNVDFNGDLDVDGTTNLDVVDIDGAVDMASTLTVAGGGGSYGINLIPSDVAQGGKLHLSTGQTANTNARNWALINSYAAYGDLVLRVSNALGGNPSTSGTSVYSALNNGTQFWSVGGSEQMRLTATGLGIGTGTPAYKLNVLSAAGAQNIFQAGQSGVSNGLSITSDGSALTYSFLTGNVGIGTSSPSSATWTNFLQVEATYPGVVYNSTAGGSNYKFSTGVDDDKWLIRDETAAATRLIVDANGNVGIGTSIPASNLVINQSGAGGQNTTILLESNDVDVGSVSIDPTSSKGLVLTSIGNFPMAFDTNGSERVRIDSSGNVGIGTSTPVTLKSATTLQVSGNAKLGDDNGRGLLSLGDIASTGANAGIWRGAAGAYAGTGNYLNLGGYDGITFTTGAADISAQTERLRIDSSGNVGIGTSSPVMPLDVMANAGANALSIRTRVGDDYSFLTFRSNDGTEDLGGLAINRTAASTSNLLFYINNGGSATERMRLDASGNLLVGTTTPNVYDGTTSGVALTQSGYIFAGKSNDAPLYLNRIASDGIITVFAKDGATMGSIGTDASGNLQTLSSSGNYRFGDSNTARWSVDVTRMYPMSDATHDIGASGVRVRDLYLSGGVYLGGTGAANLLDDYESGAFVPTVTNGDGNMSGISYITQAGYYQKIGDLVWFRMQVGFSATTIGTGNFTVTGLPYASINEASARQQATVLTYNLDWDPIWKQIHTEGVQNTSSIVFLISRDNAVWAGLQAEDMADGITYYYIISGCYVTN
jgi:cytoskeletal protein CcmA (bactofilin family)